jgi:outer membrane receptor protein involved in Fe transport
VFFKRFVDPIERFVEPTAQLRTSFQNAESARNVGLELEARKRLAPALLVGGNYTYVDSSITLSPSQTNVLTSLERPLAGTSRTWRTASSEAAPGPSPPGAAELLRRPDRGRRLARVAGHLRGGRGRRSTSPPSTASAGSTSASRPTT